MRPCRKCGAMDRQPSGHCRPCSKARHRILTEGLVNKPCVRCGATERNKRGGCKACQRARKKIWLEAPGNPQPCVKCGAIDRNRFGDCISCSRERSREWARENVVRASSQVQAWRAAHPEKAVEMDLKVRLKRYALTIQQFRSLYTLQKGLCAICSVLLPRRFDIDHDHETGVVRGLLCHPCNIGLGGFKDNQDTLFSAIQYLKLHTLQKVG
jgi:hypothetical protein